MGTIIDDEIDNAGLTVDGVDPEYAAATAQAMLEHEALLAALRSSAAPQCEPPMPPDEGAKRIKEIAASQYLYAASTKVLGPGFGSDSYLAYMHDFLNENGDPTDPIERMMLEQLAIAHHAIGNFHVRAGVKEKVEEVEIFSGAAARLMAEFRRTALALKAYRQSSANNGKPAETDPGNERKNRSSDNERRPAGLNGHATRGKQSANHSDVHVNNRMTEYLHDFELARA